MCKIVTFTSKFNLAFCATIHVLCVVTMFKPFSLCWIFTALFCTNNSKIISAHYFDIITIEINGSTG